MFETLTRLFARNDEPIAHQEPQVAVAALLVHLAAVDGSTSPEERAAVRGALMGHYGIGEADVDSLIADATRRDREAVDFYRFTSSISSLPEDERIAIVRMMWQVVFADAKNDELEDNMVWRIAELIGVTSRQRTVLRSEMARTHSSV